MTSRHALRPATVVMLGLMGWAMLGDVAVAAESTTPPAGLRQNDPHVHALVGAKIVVAPGKVIEQGTLVIRDGVITEIGADVETPPDARVWDVSGKTLYAGLIDAFGELSSDASTSGVSSSAGAGYWNANVAAHVRADMRYRADRTVSRKLRSQGITARLVAPSVGIIKGTSALVSTGDDDPELSILEPLVALHLQLTPSRSASRDSYPNSPMGAVALVRQALYDARWYPEAWAAFEADHSLSRPERSDVLEALAPMLNRERPVIVRASNELYFLRADRIGEEFDLDVIVRGSGREYRRLDAIKATGRAVILPVNFPRAPDVSTPESAANASLESLMHWDIAPENPARLAKAGVRFAFTTDGLADAATFLAAVRKAVARGLDRDAALEALTVAPAELFGAADRLGTLEAGKLAHVVVADGDLFAEKTKLLETWVDGVRYELVSDPSIDLRGKWNLRLAKSDGGTEQLTLELTGTPGKLAGKLLRGEKESKLDQVSFDGTRFSASFKGKDLSWTGVLTLSATVLSAKSDDEDPEWLGLLRWADATTSPLSAARVAAAEAASEKPDAETTAEKESEPKDESAKEAAGGRESKSKPALFPVNFPLGANGVEAEPERPSAVVFRNATVWTSGPAGVLEGASVLVRDGKIAAVGREVEVPDGAIIVDATGKHISPGVIDCHSHIATDGGVNESAQTITAEVRIGDFVDANDVNIYRQLAGGVTSSNILHGSANTIGGQNQVLKFRWGALPEEMKFAEAPQGIKFALGENVKQSNWGDEYRTRYPQTRMGVEQLIFDAFRAADGYRKRWKAWDQNEQGMPPRVDLELKALAEVLDGSRLIHCHSYRQDEILATMRVCELFGVRIGTFQHILEGYKVAEVMAEHGVGGSAFSDWWAYKFEVYDAIPYNGAIMHNAGVVVSFNSDDSELARRLPLEAAKAVKYGGVEPAEAFKFVTLNPAKQLGIDKYVGSLEPGKQADLVVWSGSPLSTYTRCEQTWVDGRKYFDREEDRKRQARASEMRAALVQRALGAGEPFADGDEESEEDQWDRCDVFCNHCQPHAWAP